MKKVFIDRKYVEGNLCKEIDVFYMKDSYILSSFAKDFFIQNRIKVSYEEEFCPYEKKIEINDKPEKTVKEIIINLLKSYNLKDEDLQVVLMAVLKKLNS